MLSISYPTGKLWDSLKAESPKKREDRHMDAVILSRTVGFSIDAIDFFSVTRAAGHRNQYKKGKKKHSLIFTQTGSIEYTFGERESFVSPAGTLAFIPSACEYTSIYRENGTTARILLFEISGGTAPVFLRSPIICVKEGIIERMSAFHGQKTIGTLSLVGKIYDLLSLLENPEKTQMRALPIERSRIYPAIRAIEEHYAENRKIAYYAALCHMSESNFRKCFRSETGASPIEYRNRIRLSQVRRLLSSGEYTVEEAAYLVGFNNLSFFYELRRKWDKESNNSFPLQRSK